MDLCYMTRFPYSRPHGLFCTPREQLSHVIIRAQGHEVTELGRHSRDSLCASLGRVVLAWGV